MTNETIKIHVYSHPTWDMKLILEASHFDYDQALENLSEDADVSLLTLTEDTMSSFEFYDLPEWDG